MTFTAVIGHGAVCSLSGSILIRYSEMSERAGRVSDTDRWFKKKLTDK